MSDRYHKAAKDGLLDVLKEATRKEVNTKDIDGMTTVSWAAFEGKLDALRLLVGRGGEPDKSDQFGNTSLHLAAAKGHMHCVDFLVKFGVNIYALDIDNHSAKDLAAINNRDDILRYLDAATSNLETTDRKRAKSMKEQAQKNSEKRAKDYAKKQQKYEQEIDNNINDINIQQSTMPHRPSTVLSAWKHKIWSGSQGNLKQQNNYNNSSNSNNNSHKDTITSNSTKFSALVGGTISAPKGVVQRKAFLAKQHQQQQQHNQQNSGGDNELGEFKVGEIEASGKRSVRSLQGVRRDSEILYVGTFNSINGNTGKRGKITDVFDVENSEYNDGDNVDFEGDDDNKQKDQYRTLPRCFSQPDFLAMSNDDDIKDEVILQRPSGLFDRPMLGSLAFPRSVTAALTQFHPDQSSIDSSNSDKNQQLQQLQQQKRIKPRSQLVISDSDTEESSSETDDQEDNSNPLERFLAAWGLEEHTHIFQKQQIDLDTLLLLTESDLKSLGLPLGPFRKLVVAIQERKNALNNPGPITDSRL